MSEVGLDTFPLFGDVAALICTYLSACDSYAALVIFRKLAGNSVVIHRRHKYRITSQSIHLTFVNGFLHSVNDEPAAIWRARAGVFEQKWFRNGLLHRDGDKPALVFCDEQSWFTDGKLRNDHRPSTLTPRAAKWGARQYDAKWELRQYQRGNRCPENVLHRMGDLPALIGGLSLKWMQHGCIYKRDNDLPSIINIDGSMVWKSRDANRPHEMNAANGSIYSAIGPYSYRWTYPPAKSDVKAFNAYKARFLSFYPIHLVDRVGIVPYLGFLQPCDFPNEN